MIQSIPFNTANHAAAHTRTLRSSMARPSRLAMLVAALLALLLVSGVMMLFGGDADAYAAESQPSSHVSIVVNSGDTLWGIASEYKSSNASIREYIYEIKKLNGLKDSSLRSGQKLLLP
ncbi:LysM peptidoglycan-binding domain-containing protein [Paenibacillus puerhi]|uniref:LysM peptidoglycan-binding domain-containing protein n=1 Tax=Paenibacillus puerhi TaxID=2692622 RepID=UPI001F375189|nr:LysM peptidoglycan-binding domain-containing protein [Paenibacillus puerhi]